MSVGQTATLINIAQYLGNDRVYQNTIYQSNGTTAQNITGWAVTFSVFKYGQPEDIFITKTVGDGIVLTTPSSGIMHITIEAADTADMNPDQYSYSIARTDTGLVEVLTYGAFTLEET